VVTTLEKWLALLTLLGAIATALGSFVNVVKPKPPPVVTTRCTEGACVATVQDDGCRTVLAVGSWWLMRCQ
jgi:hypothetical protein